MQLIEFMKFLNIDNIYDKKIPKDYINLYTDSYESNNDYIILYNENTNSKYTIEFDTYISWKVINNMGDNIITQNYDYTEDIEIEIDLINIEDYFNENVIELDNEECVIKIEKWIKSIISNN